MTQKEADALIAAAKKHAQEYPYWRYLCPELQHVYAFVVGAEYERAKQTDGEGEDA